MAIGKIMRVPLRDVWRHEERDFSAWLCSNIAELNEAIGLSLSAPDPERPAGDFSVDIVAEDDDGDIAIIENQLERSDHDHLGKLMTYVAAFSAKTAVWIVASARAEHASAVAWLNQTSDTDFYLVKAEAIRINDSAPALMLTLVVGPTPESKAIGQERRGSAERHSLRKQFWSTLLERAGSRTKLHEGCAANDTPYLYRATGVPSTCYTYCIGKDYWRVRLEIYSDDKGWNRRCLLNLSEHVNTIQTAFGAQLAWEDNPTAKVCYIDHEVRGEGYRADASEWPRIQDAMIDAMIRLANATKPYLQEAALRAGTAPSQSNGELVATLSSPSSV